MLPIAKRKYPVKRMEISINMKKTGAHIKQIILESGYTMQEIMEITGITTVQTLYKWYSGKSIPSLETQLILCKLFDLRITELLVFDRAPDFSEGRNARRLFHSTGAFVKSDREKISADQTRRLHAYLFYPIVNSSIPIKSFLAL